MMRDRMSEAFRSFLEKNSLEPDQIEAVMSDSPLVVVSAGAGSGKTLTLAWRFVRLVAVNQVPVDRILTITFTEKAALEMRERIRRLMAELQREMPAFAPLLSEALSRLDEAYVSTIHSFSMRVLKECGLSVDMDPGVRVISAPEENSFWQFLERALDRDEMTFLAATLDTLWKERALSTLSSTDYAEVMDHYGSGGVCRMAANSIPLFESRNLSPESLWDWAQDIDTRDRTLSDELMTLLSPLWEEAWDVWLRRIIPNVGGAKTFSGDSTVFSRKGAAFMERWKDAPPAREHLPEFILALMGKPDGLIGDLRGATGKIMKAVKESCISVTGQDLAGYRDSRIEWVPAARWVLDGCPPEEASVRQSLLRIVSLFWQLFESAKSSRGAISFEDMIRGARDALFREPSFPERFLHVIVDEFQDTNALQEELLSSFTPAPGRTVFFVGDLQQSIYRFRHAEPEIFWRMIRKASEDGASLVNLDITFRCRQGVMDQINGLFKMTWEGGVARSTGKPYSPLMPPVSRKWWQARQEVSVKPFEIIVTTGSGDTPPPGRAELREAALGMLGDRIREAVSSGATVWGRDGAGGFAPQPVRFRDIAVLVPSRTYYDILEKVFVEQRGIPTYFEGNRNYFDRGEVRDAVRLLEAVADQGDTLALASFLASPLSGLTPGEASSLISDSLRSGTSLFDNLAASFPDTAEWLRRCRRTGLAAGPSSALAMLLGDARILLSYPSWRRSRIAANLRRGVDLAGEYEASMGRSLTGCAAYLRDVTRRGSDAREADILGEDDDMVRVMTVHAAKGLEFPVVAVTGLEKSVTTREKGTKLTPSARLGIAPSELPENKGGEGRQKTLAAVIHDIFERVEAIEESERLLYVACTRARDSLILCGVCGQKEDLPLPEKNSWLETVSRWQEDSGGLCFSSPSGGAASPPIREKPDAAGRRSIVPSDQPARALERLSATGYALFRYCPLAFRMRHRQGMDISWEETSDGAGGADLGSLAHWILKRWDLRPETLEKFRPGPGKRSTGNLLPPELRPVWSDPSRSGPLLEWLESFSCSPVALRMREARDLQREVPFRIRLDGGVVMVGAIDVLWREDKTLFIRDYKTGGTAGAPRALYDLQLIFYALAARKHFGEMSLDLALLSLRDSSEIRVDMPEVSWQEVERDIASAAASAGSGPFGPNTGMCPSCPWRRDCIQH